MDLPTGHQSRVHGGTCSVCFVYLCGRAQDKDWHPKVASERESNMGLVLQGCVVSCFTDKNDSANYCCHAMNLKLHGLSLKAQQSPMCLLAK